VITKVISTKDYRDQITLNVKNCKQYIIIHN